MSLPSIAAPIVFLDFDGVLHPEFCHESKHFCCLPLMEDLLRQASTCLVVISSTWRLQAPVEKLRKQDRKSTRLNSSHSQISYAVFCLKKKKKKTVKID